MKKAFAIAGSVLLAASLCVPAEVAAQPEPESVAGTQVEQPAAYGRTPEPLRPYRRTGEPYRRFFVDPLAFRGPGRDEAAPEGLATVRIGLLAPLEGTGEDRLGTSLHRGVTLALEEANRRGGYRGIPFELVARNDQALWGSSANTLVQLAYTERVWAMIGSIDSNSTHVALRAALKAELAIVNVGSTDPTVTETGIPWIVRLTPDDRQTGYRLATLLFEERGLSRVAVLRGSDRYGRFGVKEFRDAARRLGRPLPMEILIAEGQRDLAAPLERIAASDVEAVVFWLRSPEDAARILLEMRRAGMRQPVVGTDRLVCSEFLALAGGAADGVEATAWMDPGRPGEGWTEFRERFRSGFGSEPDVFAAYAYDAAQMVLGAVRSQGLNRVRVRDALMGLRSYRGVTGEMVFDTTYNNVAAPVLARVEEGRFVFR